MRQKWDGLAKHDVHAYSPSTEEGIIEESGGLEFTLHYIQQVLVSRRIYLSRLSVVAHTFNPSNLEVEAGG